VDRRPIGKIEHHFFDIAPAPSFGRIVALDDRMVGCMKVLCRVLPRGLIATTDMPARAANSKMKPGVAPLQTFFASQGARNDLANAVQMGACFGHDGSSHLLQGWTWRMREKAVDRLDDLCAFADRASHTLYRSRAYVADGEHARHGGLER
jgi:hypothetical protein